MANYDKILESTSRMEAKIDNIEKTTEKLEKSIFGCQENPKESILNRITIIEECLENVSKQNQETASLLTEVSKSVSELKNIVTSHVADDNVHLTSKIKNFLTNPKVIGLVILVGYAIYQLFENGPKFLNWVLSLLGIPPIS